MKSASRIVLLVYPDGVPVGSAALAKAIVQAGSACREVVLDGNYDRLLDELHGEVIPVVVKDLAI